MFMGTTFIWMSGMQSLMISCIARTKRVMNLILRLLRLKQNVVGHVPIHLPRTFYCFLKLPCCSVSATVTSKRVNRGAGDGLEIPVEYRFFGDKTAVTWMKMQIEKIENNVNDKANKCMKYKLG